MDLTRYSPRMYVVSVTDVLSAKKIDAFEKEKGKNQPYTVHFIGRSREVGQSYITSVYTTIIATLHSFSLFLFHIPQTPDLLLTNGPGTCVPVCWASLLPTLFFPTLRPFFPFLPSLSHSRPPTKIVYVESICRVKDVSLSAKLLYSFCDRLFVQWQGLEELYPLVEYRGRLG